MELFELLVFIFLNISWYGVVYFYTGIEVVYEILREHLSLSFIGFSIGVSSKEGPSCVSHHFYSLVANLIRNWHLTKLVISQAYFTFVRQ